MGLKDLFGKKEAASTEPVLNTGWESYHYLYENDSRRAVIGFDPHYADRAIRPAYNYCRRLVIYLDPNTLSPLALPSPGVSMELGRMQDELVKALDAKSVACKLVGTMTYGGLHELVFQVEAHNGFKAVTTKWIKRHKSFKIDELSSPGWDFFETKVLPDAVFWQQISDRKVIQALRNTDTNQDAIHWLDHSFLGAPDALDKLREQLIRESYLLVSQESGSLVMTKGCFLNEDKIFAVTARLTALAQQHGVNYDGWGAAVVTEGLLSGTWKDGYGEYRWATGSIYKGPWANGKRNGKGIMFFNDGTRYEGDYVNDKRTGRGKMIWEYDEWYLGDFIDGEHHGHGEYHWPNGNVYIGDWRNGVREGHGKLIWHSKDVYTGEWKNNKRTGKGRLDYTNGDYYEGGFLDNNYHGQGREVLKVAGEIRDGQWVNGTFQGRVTTIDTSGGSTSEPVAPSPSSGGIDLRKSSSSGGTGGGTPSAYSKGHQWTHLDIPEGQQAADVLRELAQKAHADGYRPILYFIVSGLPKEKDVRHFMEDKDVSDVFEGTCIIEANWGQSDAIRAANFITETVPAFWGLREDGVWDGTFYSLCPWDNPGGDRLGQLLGMRYVLMGHLDRN